MLGYIYKEAKKRNLGFEQVIVADDAVDYASLVV